MTAAQRELLRTIYWRLGAARLDELARAVGRPRGEVLEDLCEIEGGGGLSSPSCGGSPMRGDR